MTIADRLKPYQVAHQLVHRLAPYGASRTPSMFRAASWNTLLFWSLLLDEDDEGIARLIGVDPEIPTPAEWFGKVKV